MSARDVLREALEEIPPCLHPQSTADRVVKVLLAHPVELLALLAEPKVCETCDDTNDGATYCDRDGEWHEGPCPNPACFFGSVEVDVLDLLVQVGWIHRTGALVVYGDEDAAAMRRGKWRPVFAVKAGTP